MTGTDLVRYQPRPEREARLSEFVRFDRATFRECRWEEIENNRPLL